MGRVRTKNEPVASIFEVLMTEHRDVEALFDQIEAVCEDDPEAARDLFTVLEGSLLAHAKTEDAVAYGRFEQIRELEEKIREAREEHAVVERLLGELAVTPPDGEEWLAKLKVLQENVMHHVKEEEHEVFPVAKEHIEAAESKKMATTYLQRKARHTGEPETEQARAREEAKPRPGLLTRLVRMI
jgi:hypothetical protein